MFKLPRLAPGNASGLKVSLFGAFDPARGLVIFDQSRYFIQLRLPQLLLLVKQIELGAHPEREFFLLDLPAFFREFPRQLWMPARPCMRNPGQ